MARPTGGREKNYGSGSGGVGRHGSGLGTGPVGNGGGIGGPGDSGSGSNKGYGGYPGGSPGYGSGMGGLGSSLFNSLAGQAMHQAGGYGGGNGGRKNSGCLSKIITAVIVVLVLVFILRACGFFSAEPGSYDEGTGEISQISETAGAYGTPAVSQQSQQSQTSAPWNQPQSSEGSLTAVPSAAPAENQREKFTKFYTGSESDKNTATVMVYMCGSDLESSGGMGTADLREMVNAEPGEKINLLVYTGGAKKWKNSVVSARTNQIYEVTTENGRSGLKTVESDLGDLPMSDPATLASFIKEAVEKYPSNRYILVLWDHGGGSLNGYAYDEKHPRGGYMTLAGIKQAVADSKVKFDIIGFDACLMGSLENALMLSDYADYLVASEETEPGTGWYYTNWVDLLSNDPAADTVTLSKQIIDDFTTASARAQRGAETTLAVTDLAELSARVPQAFVDFSNDTTKLLESENYGRVSNARSNTREFASSERLDQIDIVDFAVNLGTDAAEELAAQVLASVKYNRTSKGYEDAHGLSIYFPYRSARKVDTAAETYRDIGLDDSYTACIQKFANLEISGQVASGGTGGEFGSLFGNIPGFNIGDLVGTGGVSGSGSYDSYGTGYGSSGLLEEALISGMFDLFLSGRSNVAGLTAGNSKFIDEKTIRGNVSYLAEHSINEKHLKWVEKNGQKVLAFDENDWDAANDVLLNALVDDGEGLIDLGLDQAYNMTEAGDLAGAYDGTWVAINGQICAFYFERLTSNGDGYTMYAYVPALVNGERSEIRLVFTDGNPYGEVTGYRKVYKKGDGEGQAAKIAAFTDGDVIDFIADYYTYDRNYNDTYKIGDPVTYHGDLAISNIRVDGKVNAAYCITDIYGQRHWTPAM